MKTAPGYRRGYIELRDWDIKSHEHLAEFKTWADRRGGVPGQLGKSLVFFGAMTWAKQKTHGPLPSGKLVQNYGKIRHV